MLKTGNASQKKKSLLLDMCGLGERLAKIQATTRPGCSWPEIWTGMSKQRKKQEKQEWALEKPMLDNARKLRGIYCFDLEDEEYHETIKCKKEVRSSCGSCCALQHGDLKEC